MSQPRDTAGERSLGEQSSPERDASYYFSLLHPLVQKWIHRQGWHSLHPIQQKAIEPILEHKDDVIISASTAAGKTEAAFLPILTYLKQNEKQLKGVSVLYVSPLKALINDQARRLSDMAEELDIKVTPWHGDVASHKKSQLIKQPSGILLITPESLESLLINRVDIFKNVFSQLVYVVIDEFHALMGAERGYQLQSQLHRIENLICRVPVRIAISATFSNDIGSVATYLRSNWQNKFMHCQIITANQQTKSALAVKIFGYSIEPLEEYDPDNLMAEMHEQALEQVAVDAFRILRGKNNLLFTNSRADAERLAHILSVMSQNRHVPEEFFPHHGSLAKELRESLEMRLQEGNLPTTAICTSTLELGIDISEVHSIAQLAPPTSVSSLRQRLGRSGRRDGRAVLRLFIPELSLGMYKMKSLLCEDTVLSAAMINLLLKRWYEPPLKQEYALSTLVQQTLSVLAATGGASAKNLYALLCKTGPFSLVTPDMYAKLLRSLGVHDLITQMRDGVLTLGCKGEYLVSNYEFFAAFNNNREYVIENEGQVIGRIPVFSPLAEDDTFLFAGKGWKVVFFNEQKRIIGVKAYTGKTDELPFGGAGGKIHDALREEMLRIYMTGQVPPCLDERAMQNLEQGRAAFMEYQLDKRLMVSGPQGFCLFPWKGDCILETIVLMLKRVAINAERVGSHIELEYTSKENLSTAVGSILLAGEIEPTELLQKVKTLDWEKFNCYLPHELKQISYAHSHLDVKGALQFFSNLAHEL